jgi:phosphoglycolate phosphatase-like HAD superfamily hydrolase
MIVFDLDGTLALDHHRVHHLKGEEKNWDAYFAACGDDEPATEIIKLMRGLTMIGEKCAIWSGRSMSAIKETEAWIKQHNLLGYVWEIRMRHVTDRTQDDILKKQWLDEHNAAHPDDPVTLVFEDRARVVAMWRANGIVCCQVAPGDF